MHISTLYMLSVMVAPTFFPSYSPTTSDFTENYKIYIVHCEIFKNFHYFLQGSIIVNYKPSKSFFSLLMK